MQAKAQTSFIDEFKPGINRQQQYKSKNGFDGNDNFVEKVDLAEDNEYTQFKLNFDVVKQREIIDEKFGFERYLEGEGKLGWLVNLHDTLVDSDSCADGLSAVDLYFLKDDGSSFKATIPYEPYFYVVCKVGSETEVEEYLRRGKRVKSCVIVTKDDLDLANHLSGKKSFAIKLTFHNMDHFKAFKSTLLPIISRNEKRNQSSSHSLSSLFELEHPVKGVTKKSTAEAMDCIIGLREHDISYYSRAMIDLDIRVGVWYEVKALQGTIILTPKPEIVRRADPVVFAFDIETTKLPLRFPDANVDNIMMISYMIDGRGFLITNREVVGSDIDDFEYSPSGAYKGEFTIFNEVGEAALLQRFFEHIVAVRPTVFVTYNGDFFDWPFIHRRAEVHGLDMALEIGVSKTMAGEYLSSYAAHMDCYCWVKRDSYLPQGSQNLKAVAKHKLGYDPVELDPELMTRYAVEKPQILAQYSVSDAVATYYLYMKYVHPFTFSLCNIIPMHPDDVLRRGSGTLCEHLLVVRRKDNSDQGGNFFSGHMLNGETYVGGHVEALEAGVFRSDLPTNFALSAEAFQELINEIDAALKFSLTKEGNVAMDDVLNYDEVRAGIVDGLSQLRDRPNRDEKPSIYHLDVAAMYPNIILTNRLQPDAIVDDTTCAACDFNEGPGSSCQRTMTWKWRGEAYMASKGEYNMLRNQLEQEKFPGKRDDLPERPFHDLSPAEQEVLVKKRMGDYSQKVYGKKFSSTTMERESIVCQRENPFYVNTVRDFRDRRYEYKALLKKWKRVLEEARKSEDAAAIDEASKMTVIYDSLQTAHKCILNSFYGYVMRKAARWYSMEMAGIVCLTGSKIIQLARKRVENIGKPLELDTDGIWCVLPASFPENFTFLLKDGKKYSISYPCVMLNHLVHDQFTNDQYQELDPVTGEYVTSSENSIFFEVDGPYRAMILPASLEEGKLLKKRYAVFNHDGTIAELKGFELKRRGELKLIKNFQGSIFKVFLEGNTLKECYDAVASVADSWLDILYSKGVDLTDAEVFDLVSENRSMSKALESYGAQKSTSITTAKRLAEFLGEQMVQDKGLNCQFIITIKPHGAPVSERAVPIAIFQSEGSVRKHFLRKWLKDNSLDEVDIRDLIDWEYYLERFSGTLQKLITIPAGLQNLSNPIPRIAHPDWLKKRTKTDKHRQTSITDTFMRIDKSLAVDHPPLKTITDMEDLVPSLKKELATVPEVRLSNGKRRVKARDQYVMPESVKGVKLKKIKQRKQRPPPKSLNPYNIHKEYVLWLEAQRPIWLEQQRINRSITGGSLMAKKGISKHFESSASLMVNRTWEILQIAETDSLGIFRVWAIVNNNLESIDIEVPRIFFVNSKVAALDDGQGFATQDVQVSKRSRTLPRNHQCMHLYEFQMSEYHYQNRASEFASMFNHKDIEGVYETQVPLIFRALIQLGSFGVSSIASHQFDRTKPLALSQVRQANSPSSYYLQDGSFSLVYIFQAHSGSKQFIGVFNPTSNAMHVFIVDSGLNRDAIPPIKRTYIEARSAFDQDQLISPHLSFPLALEHSTPSVVATEKEAFTLLNRLLLNFKGIAGKPVMFMIQSTKSLKYYRNSGVAAFREFPTMAIPSHKSDSSFPAVGWQKYAIDRLFINLFNLPMFLQNRIELARYANVPVCNIETDYTIFLSDLFLARRLKSVDSLLWCSPSQKPDLGGSEQDDHRSAFGDLKCPEINLQTTCDTVCIEIEIWDLALNTLVKSFENSGDFDQSATNSTSKGSIYRIDSHFSAADKNEVVEYAEKESTHHAFAALRAMIKDWIAEAKNGNQYAGNVAEHLHRWLTTSGSLLYDDMIVSQIHNMMKRALASILEELRRLGSKIIYASFDKIILATSKTTIQAGAGYIAYVLEAIKRDTSFQHIDMKPIVFWDYLVWYDPFNHGGLVYRNEAGTHDIQDLAEMGVHVDFRWHISEFLPPPVQQAFLTNIAEYLDAVRQLKGSTSAVFTKSLTDYIDTNFKRQLYLVVKDIHRHRMQEGNDESAPQDKNLFAFPRLPGSCRKMTNPALEFVKMITMILMLNTDVENQVRLMKKDLLRLIDVREFSADAVFMNPCEKYILPQVICHYCSFGCDLDLTRKEGKENEETASFLVCEQCNMLYDRDDIEHRLIQDLESLLSRWQLQDLRCKTCHLVKAEDLRQNCAKCTGELETVLDQERFLRQLHVLSNLADFFRMETLREVSNFVQGQAI